MKNYTLPTKVDLSKCILWQYNNATRLQQIIKMLEDGTNASSADLWVKTMKVFDLETPIDENADDYEARMHGLFALSILFGLDRPTYMDNGVEKNVNPNVWRRYLRGMIWLMDSDGSVPDINKWISLTFPGVGHCYVVDNLDMGIQYCFSSELTGDDLQLINIPGFMPHPAGVLIGVRLDEYDRTIGFMPPDDATENERGNFDLAHFAVPEEE